MTGATRERRGNGGLDVCLESEWMGEWEWQWLGITLILNPLLILSEECHLVPVSPLLPEAPGTTPQHQWMLGVCVCEYINHHKLNSVPFNQDVANFTKGLLGISI